MIALFALNACQEVAGRLTWAFARDNALMGSKYFGHVDKKLQVPVWALLGNAFVILVIGCVYLGSTTAFNAFIGSGLLLQQCTFAIPAALLLWHRRSEAVLPKSRYIRLGALGWVANVVTVAFAPLITVMYCFPIQVPVTGSSMSTPFLFLFRSTPKANLVFRLYCCCDRCHDHLRPGQLGRPCWSRLQWSTLAKRFSSLVALLFCDRKYRAIEGHMLF